MANPETSSVVIAEYMGNITAYIPGIRATAELSELGQSEADYSTGGWLRCFHPPAEVRPTFVFPASAKPLSPHGLWQGMIADPP